MRCLSDQVNDSSLDFCCKDFPISIKNTKAGKWNKKCLLTKGLVCYFLGLILKEGPPQLHCEHHPRFWQECVTWWIEFEALGKGPNTLGFNTPLGDSNASWTLKSAVLCQQCPLFDGHLPVSESKLLIHFLMVGQPKSGNRFFKL